MIGNINKINYILICNNTSNESKEQTIFLIDEINKKYIEFYFDGYDGMSQSNIKILLDFLDINYFECIYSNELFADKCKELKSLYSEVKF